MGHPFFICLALGRHYLRVRGPLLYLDRNIADLLSRVFVFLQICVIFEPTIPNRSAQVELILPYKGKISIVRGHEFV